LAPGQAVEYPHAAAAIRRAEAMSADRATNVLPKIVSACGFANAKAPGYEADDFLAAAVAAEERQGGTVLVASGDRDTFQLASEATTILFPVRAGEMARIGPAEVRERYGVEPKQVPELSLCVAILPTSFRELAVSDRKALLICSVNTAVWMRYFQPGASPVRPKRSGCIAQSRR
jgi:hypothetical protein